MSPEYIHGFQKIGNASGKIPKHSNMVVNDFRPQHEPVLAMTGKRVEEEFIYLGFQQMYKHFCDVIMFIKCHTYLLMFIDLIFIDLSKTYCVCIDCHGCCVDLHRLS